jgi:NAD(P)H-quinone oxidoreductase subunit 5
MLIAASLGFLRPARLSATAKAACQALALAALGSALLALMVLLVSGPRTASLALLPGLSARVDAVSVALLVLIAFIGWVVVRYSTVYLDGERREGHFMAWLCATLACVMSMVIAGHLALLVAGWIGTGLALHRLLLFYPDRAGARRAARKKFVVARLGDLALVTAALLLFFGHGTGDIATLAGDVRREGGSAFDAAAAAMLALAAILKSAQFPLHGWLTEVMEAPTPVSALLHAGVINGGGFILIRFADVMLAAPAVLALLVMIGGFTAIIGGVTMLTQPAVKTSLAWSTIAQMGFMIMQCGLGLFPLALLHIIAHSLYKAHSFLASGGAVERIAAARRPGPVAIPSLAAVARSFVVALGLYVAIGLAFGFHHKAPQAIALGAILILGVAYLFAQGLAGGAPRGLSRRIVAYAVAASVGYFALHAVAFRLTAGALPPPPAPDALGWVLIGLAVLSFALVAVAQTTFPLWAGHPAVAGLRVHLANGLYANALFDRLLGSWKLRRN